MVMITIEGIKYHVFEYLAGHLDFRQFEDWLIDHSWNSHKDSDPVACELGHSIDFAIYPYLDGHIDEGQLKASLRALMAEPKTTITFDARCEDMRTRINQRRRRKRRQAALRLWRILPEIMRKYQHLSASTYGRYRNKKEQI